MRIWAKISITSFAARCIGRSQKRYYRNEQTDSKALSTKDDITNMTCNRIPIVCTILRSIASANNSDERLQGTVRIHNAAIVWRHIFQRIFKDADLSHVKVGIYLATQYKEFVSIKAVYQTVTDTACCHPEDRLLRQNTHAGLCIRHRLYIMRVAHMNFPQILIVIGTLYWYAFCRYFWLPTTQSLSYKRLTYEKSEM